MNWWLYVAYRLKIIKNEEEIKIHATSHLFCVFIEAYIRQKKEELIKANIKVNVTMDLEEAR